VQTQAFQVIAAAIDHLLVDVHPSNLDVMAIMKPAPRVRILDAYKNDLMAVAPLERMHVSLIACGDVQVAFGCQIGLSSYGKVYAGMEGATLRMDGVPCSGTACTVDHIFGVSAFYNLLINATGHRFALHFSAGGATTTSNWFAVTPQRPFTIAIRSWPVTALAGEVFGEVSEGEYSPAAINVFDAYGKHVIFEEIGTVVDGSEDHITFEKSARVIDSYYKGLYVQLFRAAHNSLQIGRVQCDHEFCGLEGTRLYEILEYQGGEKKRAVVDFDDKDAPAPGDTYRIVYALRVSVYPESAGKPMVTRTEGSLLASVQTPRPAISPFGVAQFTDLRVFEAQYYRVNLTFGSHDVDGNEWNEIFNLPGTRFQTLPNTMLGLSYEIIGTQPSCPAQSSLTCRQQELVVLVTQNINPIQVTMRDFANNRVSFLREKCQNKVCQPKALPTEINVTATIFPDRSVKSGMSCRRWSGTTNCKFKAGSCTFTDLRIYAANAPARIIFTASVPGKDYVKATSWFIVESGGPVSIKFANLLPMASFTLSLENAGVLPNQPSVIMVDAYDNVVPRTATAYLFKVTPGQKCPGQTCVYTRPCGSNCPPTAEPMLGNNKLDTSGIPATDLAITKAGVDYILLIDFYSVRSGLMTDWSSIFTVFAGSPNMLLVKSYPRCPLNKLSSFDVALLSSLPKKQETPCAYAGTTWMPQFSVVVVDGFQNELRVSWTPIEITSLPQSNPERCKDPKQQIKPLRGTLKAQVSLGTAIFTDLQVDCVRRTTAALYSLEISSPANSSIFVTGIALRPILFEMLVLPGEATHMQLESPDFSGKIFFAGALLKPEPKLSLRDAFDNEAWNSDAVVHVSLLGSFGNLVLIGSLALPSYSSTNADVMFPDLRVPRPDFGLTLKFCLEGRPSRKRFCGIDDRTVVMGPFDVVDLGSLHVQHHVVEKMFAADTLVSAAGLPPTLILMDKSGNKAKASGISIRAMLNSYEPDKLVRAETEPELLGEQVVQSVEGVITYNNLLLQVSGNYTLSFQAEYSWTPGLDRAVASFSWLHAVTRFYVVPARESASCFNKSACILNLLDHSRNSTAGSSLTVQVLLTDPYQNRIARRRLVISFGLNPTSADLLGDLSVTTDDTGHAMFSVQINAACNRLWCVRCNGTIAGQHGCTGSWISGAVGGYKLLIATGGVSVQTNLIEIFPDLDLVAYWINMTTIVQEAGQEVNPVPLFWPLDKYGNLFDTRGMPQEWEIVYEGIGFLPCADEEPTCEDMEERVKARRATRCLGASTPGYRPLQLRFSSSIQSRV
jgi:hypothetical protein